MPLSPTTPASRPSVLLFDSSLCSQILPSSLVWKSRLLRDETSSVRTVLFVWSTLCSVWGTWLTNTQLTRTDLTTENQVEAQTPAVVSSSVVSKKKKWRRWSLAVVDPESSVSRWCDAGPLGSESDPDPDGFRRILNETDVQFTSKKRLEPPKCLWVFFVFFLRNEGIWNQQPQFFVKWRTTSVVQRKPFSLC